MLYTCENCHFVFETPVAGSHKLYCPYCGNGHIRLASEFEKERYEREQEEFQEKSDK